MRSFLGMASAAIMAAFLGLVLWSYHQVFSLHQLDIYSESGLLENIQAFVLAIACLTFLWPVIFEKRSDKLILLFFSLLCYAFVLREVDVEDLDIPDFLKAVGHGAGRNITVAAALVLILTFFAFNFFYYVSKANAFLRSISGTLILMGMAFLFCGLFFEKSTSISHHVYFEEIFELLGDIFLFLGALSVHSFSRPSFDVAP